MSKAIKTFNEWAYLGKDLGMEKNHSLGNGVFSNLVTCRGFEICMSRNCLQLG